MIDKMNLLVSSIAFSASSPTVVIAREQNVFD
jgi:hypothetical protein